MQNVEIEYKVMVSKKDFEILKESLSKRPFCLYDQTNHYYDTSCLELRKNHLSLRIRFIENENKYILTLKERLIEGKLEHEFVVKNNDISCFPNEIIEILNNHNINYKDIKETAQLRTIRLEYKDKDYTLCLDHSFYYNKEDYEIECEANSMESARNYVIDLLNKHNISYQESVQTKLARAMSNRS